MADQDRLDRMFGEQRPVRVIPARIPDDPARNRPTPGTHKSFREIRIDPSHPEWDPDHHLEDVHNVTLHHEHEGAGFSQHVVVSSANRKALEDHLGSTSIWTLASRSAPDAPPRFVHVQQVVEDAVLKVTGKSVAQHLDGPREELHVHYHDLLGTQVARDVRGAAVNALKDALSRLVSIDAEDKDLATIKAGWVVDLFLRSKAAVSTGGSSLADHHGHAEWLKSNPGAVLTRFGPVPDGHEVAFSIRDSGTVSAGQAKVYWLGQGKRKSSKPWKYAAEVDETVTVSDGDVKASIYLETKAEPEWSAPSIKPSGKKAGRKSSGTLTSTAGNWALQLYGNAPSSVSLEGTWSKKELS